MQEVAMSLGSIIILALVFYFVIKWAVRKAIIEAKVNEAKYAGEVADDALFLELSECMNGTTGMGTEMFDGLTKEQKESFKPRFKEISRRFTRLYFQGAFQGAKDRHSEMVQLKTLLDEMQLEVDALKS